MSLSTAIVVLIVVHLLLLSASAWFMGSSGRLPHTTTISDTTTTSRSRFINNNHNRYRSPLSISSRLRDKPMSSPQRIAASSSSSSSNSHSDDARWFWATSGLDFQCTGCGRCCQMEGEVWLTMDEFIDLVDSLHLSVSDVLDCYVDTVIGTWVRLKERVITTSKQTSIDGTIHHSNHTACIFLSENDNKSCTIYQQRPLPCKTYPFWPRILQNAATWEKERVLPVNTTADTNNSFGDEVTSGLRQWTPQSGGCEGIQTKLPSPNSQNTSSTVPPMRILASMEATAYRQEKFDFEVKPLLQQYESLIALGKREEVERHQMHSRKILIEETNNRQLIVNATKRWVEDFVIHYNLCPFANPVYQQKKVKYVVSYVNDASQALFRLCQEALYLLSVPQSEVETTLIVYPFLAATDFMEFYRFSLQVEDHDFPLYLAKLRNALQLNQNRPKGFSNIVKRIAPKIDKEADDLQLAFFHPYFRWKTNDSPLRDRNSNKPFMNSRQLVRENPLNFEKRAPFPTINILRSNKVNAYANEAKSQRIGDLNKKRLEDAGLQELSKKMFDIMRCGINSLEETQDV